MPNALEYTHYIALLNSQMQSILPSLHKVPPCGATTSSGPRVEVRWAASSTKRTTRRARRGKRGCRRGDQAVSTHACSYLARREVNSVPSVSDVHFHTDLY